MFAIYKIGNLICCWAAPSSNVQKFPCICILAFSEFEMKQRKISSCCFFEVLSRNSFFSLSWWIFMGIQMISQVILHNYIIFLNSISIARHAWERERPPPPRLDFSPNDPPESITKVATAVYLPNSMGLPSSARSRTSGRSWTRVRRRRYTIYEILVKFYRNSATGWRNLCVFNFVGHHEKSWFSNRWVSDY